MKDIIRVQLEKSGDIGRFKTNIYGNNPDIIGALVCILDQLIDDGKYDIITKALELSSKDILVKSK